MSIYGQKLENEHILEVGVGTGNNIRYYPSQAKITAIDYSEKMMVYAKKQAHEQNRNIDFHFMDVQSLDFEDNTFDQAVVTYVFCSVPDPILGLQELSRVVKSGGDIFFLEHGPHQSPNYWKTNGFSESNNCIFFRGKTSIVKLITI